MKIILTRQSGETANMQILDQNTTPETEILKLMQLGGPWADDPIISYEVVNE